MYAWFSATAREPGTCDGMPTSGGCTARSLRNTMPLCCCVSPLHSAASTGSEIVGKPTSTVSVTPRLHSADHVGSVLAVSADRPSIRIARTRGADVSPAPLATGSDAGDEGTASHVVTSSMNTWRTWGSAHAAPSRTTAPAPLVARSIARNVAGRVDGRIGLWRQRAERLLPRLVAEQLDGPQAQQRRHHDAVGAQRHVPEQRAH